MKARIEAIPDCIRLVFNTNDIHRASDTESCVYLGKYDLEELSLSCQITEMELDPNYKKYVEEMENYNANT